jgi:hypothetical protein
MFASKKAKIGITSKWGIQNARCQITSIFAPNIHLLHICQESYTAYIILKEGT